jgi:hypothetical protein
MDGLANGLFFRRNPLYFFHNNSKNFDELGVKAQKFAGIVIGSYRARYYCHFNDGTVINGCKPAIFRHRTLSFCIEINLF